MACFFYYASLSLYIVLQARSIMHFAANPIDFPDSGVFPSSRMISRPVSKGTKAFVS